MQHPLEGSQQFFQPDHRGVVAEQGSEPRELAVSCLGIQEGLLSNSDGGRGEMTDSSSLTLTQAEDAGDIIFSPAEVCLPCIPVSQ